MSDKHVNVFISHIHEDDAGLKAIKDLVLKHGLKMRDSSINSSNPNEAKSEDYIKSQILAPQIDWAGTLVVYVTPETKNSKWVEWEIEYAERAGKRIVGVWGPGDTDCDLPPALDKYADAMVSWKGKHIVDAITGDYDGWQKPDGVECQPRDIKRYSC